MSDNETLIDIRRALLWVIIVLAVVYWTLGSLEETPQPKRKRSARKRKESIPITLSNRADTAS